MTKKKQKKITFSSFFEIAKQKTFDFSKENWWVYIIFLITLGIVFYTETGKLLEIILTFCFVFLANLSMMIMQDYYTLGKNRLGSIFQSMGFLFFTGVSLYGWLINGEAQYLIFQICYFLAAAKTILNFNTKINVKHIDEIFLGVVNVVVLFLFWKYFYTSPYQIFQVLWFAFVTTGLVSLRHYIEYYFNLIGVFLITFGSGFGIFVSYLEKDVPGIIIAWFLMTATVLIFYLKLLPKYIKK